ncbi:flagellar filament capping protein FliD [Halobacteriovorax sp. HLS]|uniref:flagellar filament capping protein FliD n=1 Tax=Halobacteriovorax sp. HLS TaxID=2234000 RepID=UPI000FD74B4C|nr:flagellar filament capping protein FliD [Halobacteriovorax sp. HLS]
MSISFGSINTGLPKDIVKQIVAAERIPLQKMDERKGKISDKKALVGELIKLMEGVKGEVLKNGNARSLRELKVQTNDDIIGVSADKNIAQPGTYQLEVTQLSQKSSAMTSGFEDPDESYVGVGFIQYYLPNGDSKELYVDSDNSSLNSLAKMINKDSDNGLRASVINDGSGGDEPWRMILSLEDTGDEKRAEFPYFYFVDGENDLYLEFEREAHDAKIKLDGFDIELPENKASELIPGLTIDLKKAKPGEEFSLTVTEDSQAVAGKVEDIVTSINGVLQFIKTQNQMDENTDTSRTLGGDSILQSLESRLRATIFQDIKTEKGYKRLSDLGIKFQRDGLLKLDSEVLGNFVSKDYKMVSQILTGYFGEEGKSPGFVDHLNNTVKTALQFPNGLLQSRKRSLDTNIDQIDRRIVDKERRIEQKEKNLKDKFARLEGTIARMKSQGAGVSALGAAGPDPVQQLG